MPSSPSPREHRVEEAPIWDAARRRLSLAGRVVKQFRQPAVSQERILDAFQEDGWPPRIDDPLPPNGSTQTPQDRLHDAIKALNAHQLEAHIHFYRDGTGHGVGWELPPRPKRRPRKRRR
jgi:hypothetical protein